MPPFDTDEQIVQLHHITVVDSLAEGKRNLLISEFILYLFFFLLQWEFVWFFLFQAAL